MTTITLYVKTEHTRLKHSILTAEMAVFCW